MPQDFKQIVWAKDVSQDVALKISRLPQDQQAEAVSLLAAGIVRSVEQYQQERRVKIMAAYLSPLDALPVDTRIGAEKDREKVESLKSFVQEFSDFIDQSLDRMKMYQKFADAFAEMSPLQKSNNSSRRVAYAGIVVTFGSAGYIRTHGNPTGLPQPPARC